MQKKRNKPLEVEDLVVDRGGLRVLKGVSLNVKKGEIVAIIGSNGAGKTTFVESIVGLVSPTSGSIRFRGEEIQTLQPYDRAKRGITLIREGKHIFPRISVWENLRTGCNTERSKETMEQTLNFIYELFPILEKRKNQRGGSLSGGEQQMLAISRGLMTRPNLMILDEISLGLAPILVDQLFKSMGVVKKEFDMVVLISEQNVREALSIASRGYVLEEGKFVLEGTGKELLLNKDVKSAYGI